MKSKAAGKIGSASASNIAMAPSKKKALRISLQGPISESGAIKKSMITEKAEIEHLAKKN